MAKRGNGEGSIYQRTDGRWCGAISLLGSKRKTIYGKTRKEVAERMKTLLREQQQGINIAPKHYTLVHFLTEWMETCVKPACRYKTIQSYEQLIRLYITPYVGTVRLDKWTVPEVQKLFQLLLEKGNTRYSKGLAPRTVRNVRALLVEAFDQAVRWEHLHRNVAALTDPIKLPALKRIILDPQEARHLLQTITGDRLEGLYRLTLAYGFRKGEALGVRWKDIDLLAGTIHIAGAIQVQDGKRKYVPTKTDAGDRILPLPESLITFLRQHKIYQDLERKTVDKSWEEHGYVFPSEVGTPIRPDNLIRQFKRLLKRAALPKEVRFHDLRHSAATFMLLEGIDAKTVSEILGHTNVHTTLNTYAHALPESKRRAVNAVIRRIG